MTTATRTAPLAVAGGSSFARFASAVWSVLVQLGHHRARREISQLADRYESSRPELAKQLRAAAESPWQ